MFEQLLSCVGTVSQRTLKSPKADNVTASVLKPEIELVYCSLGGILPSISLNLYQWDLEFDGIAVELDEDLHFNRYRSITLKSAIYERLPRFPLKAYQRYCSQYEKRCLQAGASPYGKWSSNGSEVQFGEASKPGVLPAEVTDMQRGSPRWKQRAFYDFVKDLSPLLIHVPVVRVAVWDAVEDGDRSRTVNEVLAVPLGCASSFALAALIKERAADCSSRLELATPTPD